MKSLLKSLSRSVKKPTFPLLLILVANLVVGILTFRDFGYSWDEPYFYGYADAIGYAYSIKAHQSPDFDINKAFGPSPGDHGNRGPGYILIARWPVYAIQALTGLDTASTWHLVNFLFFQLGLVFFYLLCLRWVKPWSAFAATLLYSSQPLVWGHSFINPKDPSFLIAFTIAMYLGLRMADRLAASPPDEKPLKTLAHMLPAAIMLGMATAIRILGPLVGFLVVVYYLSLRRQPRKVFWLIPYGLIAIMVMFAAWPYLWSDPVGKFLEVFGFMSDNPANLQVLFYGKVYQSHNLPLRYLPFLLLTTLTEPVWLLFAGGIAAAIYRTIKKKLDWKALLVVLAWAGIPTLYVLIKRPSMYDGFRHFLFILPPIFIVTALAFESIFGWLRQRWIQLLLIAAILAPGVIGAVQLHPYEYAYYNSFVGGTGGAFRNFETEYWLTCYKESMEQFNQQYAAQHPTIWVYREFYIAAYYAADGVTVKDFRQSAGKIKPGDFFLVSTRTNQDRRVHTNVPDIITVRRDGAIFCAIRKLQEE